MLNNDLLCNRGFINCFITKYYTLHQILSKFEGSTIVTPAFL